MDTDFFFCGYGSLNFTAHFTELHNNQNHIIGLCESEQSGLCGQTHSVFVRGIEGGRSV
jgi:hypothetical protein